MPDFFSNQIKVITGWIEPNIRLWLETRQPQMWVLATVAGLAVSVAAILFRELIGFVQLFWLGDSSENVASAARDLPWYMILAGPTIGGFVVGLALYYLVPSRRTAGVADVIEARARSGSHLGMRYALTSAVITAISLGAGGSAGREGPVVHLGASLASATGRLFRLPDWAKRTILAGGVAAAVSASFNAPIAGVLFAHEVILGHYAMRAFVPIVLASVAGTILSRLWFGDVAAFIIPEYQITSFWEIPAFALLGVVCALVSILFQVSLISTDYVARNLKIHIILRPVIGGLAIGTIALAFPEILGVGYEATDDALRNQLSLWLMLSLLVAKTAATAITLASRFGGGVFSPSLYLGAMAGGAFGLIASKVFPDLASSEALYAILGMGAVAAAVLGAPISTTVMVFELTGGYALSIALLLCVSVANGVNHAIHGHSFFQWQLEMRGLFVADGPSRHVMRAQRVRDFMVPIGEEENDKLEDPDALPVLHPGDTLEKALRTFDSGGHERLPVVEEKAPETIVGWADQVRALRYFNKALVEASEEEHHH
ncbi:MAG: chloride channel protein [Pseudomonadota bacterium]